ncbi:MAG: cation diffusion facilitator family transporter [Candidatus Omnitrophica bacterium]|nr:cation diffusion facilitator family transporter [Candidatus Omnitrophota bacterium]
MKQKIALISILANIILAVSKISIGFISGSMSILAAGIDSLTDIFSSFVSYLGIKISLRPADKRHPYGYHKFEVLAGVAITFIILFAGIKIIYDAYQNLRDPSKVSLDYLSFGVMIFSVLVNEVMARAKIYYGKKENSISLLSDGVHSRIDVYTSLAVLFGLFLTKYWIYADTVLAFAIGIYIIKGAFSIGKEAGSSLLDVSAGEEVEEKIKKIAKDKDIEIISLKTQKRGSAITANLEINLPSNLKVEEAVKLSNSLRERLVRKIETLKYISIQINSHEMETGFFKPDFGDSFGWQQKGRFKDKIEKASGKGPEGYCVCEKCGYRIKHQRGAPCAKLKCPKCKISLKRE